MSKPRNAYEVTLPGGSVVVLAELTCSELLLAMKATGSEPAAMVRGLAVSREALRLSVRSIDGEPVAVHDLMGDGWKKHFPRTRHTFQLANAWGQIHSPTDDEIDKIMKAAAIEDDGETERWTLTLPGGRSVVMVEGDPDTVEDVMRRASVGTKSEAAQEFGVLLDGCRRSIRQIDGAAVGADDLAGKAWDNHFSVRETFILGRAWRGLHVGEEAVGELKPVPGT